MSSFAILHGGAHADLGLLPLGAAQPVQLDVGVFARPDVFGDHVQLGDRDIEHIALGVFELDVILTNPVHVDFMDSLDTPMPCEACTI